MRDNLFIILVCYIQLTNFMDIDLLYRHQIGYIYTTIMSMKILAEFSVTLYPRYKKLFGQCRNCYAKYKRKYCCYGIFIILPKLAWTVGR